MKNGVSRRRKTEKAEVAPKPALFYRVNALLHTIRAIEQREDQLCSILHEIKVSGRVSAEVSEELRVLLREIPSREYQGELEALEAALG